MKVFLVALAIASTARGFSMSSSVNAVRVKAEAGVRTAPLQPTSNEYLSLEALEAAKSGNKWEQVKMKRAGDIVFEDVYEWASAVRSGQLTWEQLQVDDIDIRAKWAGLFHRRKRNAGTFMMRLKIPNGIVTSQQMRYFGEAVQNYDPALGVLDITTRQNMQLRGVTLEDADTIIDRLKELGLSCYMSGADNTRNVVGHPLAGIDPLELVDTRQLCKEINEMIVGPTGDSPEFANLPRKFNIAVSGSRDDYAHTHINDLGLVPVADPESGEMGFNIIVGGFFSIKRAAMSVPLDMWIPVEAAVKLCKAVLQLYRDAGSRENRQKNRLMYLVEDMGVEGFKAAVSARAVELGISPASIKHAVPEPQDHFERRDFLGVHPQKQEGLCFLCTGVPVGRLLPADTQLIGDFADAYSSSEIRLTVDQRLVFPNIAAAEVQAALQHPLLQRFPLQQGALSANTVSCTGATFCGLGLMVTKERALDVNAKLEAKLHLPRPVRIHWTGCNNSCGQAQVADLAVMGSVAKVDGKTVEGVDIFMGGTIGENPTLGAKVITRLPAADEHLLPALEGLLIEHFGASYKL